MRVFSETQRFTQWPIRLASLGILGFLIFALYRWYVIKEAVGNVNADDTTGQLVVLSVLGLVILLFFILQLKTEIDEKGIHYRYIPFHFKDHTIPWNDIEKCFVRTYSPIMEYGGWGYRISLKRGKAYNVSGSKGIQIVLKSGKKILIGTQNGSEATLVINRYLKKEHERI